MGDDRRLAHCAHTSWLLTMWHHLFLKAPCWSTSTRRGVFVFNQSTNYSICTSPIPIHSARLHLFLMVGLRIGTRAIFFIIYYLLWTRALFVVPALLLNARAESAARLFESNRWFRLRRIKEPPWRGETFHFPFTPLKIPLQKGWFRYKTFCGIKKITPNEIIDFFNKHTCMHFYTHTNLWLLSVSFSGRLPYFNYPGA